MSAPAQAQQLVRVPDAPEDMLEVDPLPPGEEPVEEIPEASPAEKSPPRRAIESKPLPPPAPRKPANTIRLMGLNKTTARSTPIEAPLGTLMRFGTLEIIARRCWQPQESERPDSVALLEVREQKPGEAPRTIFSGWMYASSPGLSALEHPVYDVTVLACEYKDMSED